MCFFLGQEFEFYLEMHWNFARIIENASNSFSLAPYPYAHFLYLHIKELIQYIYFWCIILRIRLKNKRKESADLESKKCHCHFPRDREKKVLMRKQECWKCCLKSVTSLDANWRCFSIAMTFNSTYIQDTRLWTFGHMLDSIVLKVNQIHTQTHNEDLSVRDQ